MTATHPEVYARWTTRINPGWTRREFRPESRVSAQNVHPRHDRATGRPLSHRRVRIRRAAAFARPVPPLPSLTDRDRVDIDRSRIRAGPFLHYMIDNGLVRLHGQQNERCGSAACGKRTVERVAAGDGRITPPKSCGFVGLDSLPRRARAGPRGRSR